MHIARIIALSDSSTVSELGPAIGASLEEVERFYNHDVFRATFSTIAQTVQGLEGLPLTGAGYRLAGMSGHVEHIFARSRGRFKGTVDASVIGPLLRESAGISDDAPYVAVIDHELTPPPEWRYIMSVPDRNGGVVSIRPVDPAYWRDKTERRVCIIKHRVRTLCLKVVGTLLGLARCENPTCFLYNNIDSVTCLDSMMTLCEEHGIEALAHYGYAADVDDPAAVQSIERDPRALSLLR